MAGGWTRGWAGNASSGGGGGLAPAAFTVSPSSVELGVARSGYVDVSADRLTGFAVSLSGDIASVASVATEIGSTVGGCAGSAGQDCRVTITRTGGVIGTSYSGSLVLTDESGNSQAVPASLDVPTLLRMVAQGQGAKYIWAMDTSGVSQPNRGTGGTLDLTLTGARDTSTQDGAEGEFTIANAVADRGYAAMSGTPNMSIVVAVNLTEVTATRAIFSGNNFGNSSNPGYLAISSYGYLVYQKMNMSSGIVLTTTPTTGVWAVAITINSSGTVNAYARKVGASILSGTCERGSAVSGTDNLVLGGNGVNYYSAIGDYYFLAVYDSVIGETEFNELHACLG